MPVFSIEIPDGRTVDIEAADQGTALAGARQWYSENQKETGVTADNVVRQIAKGVPIVGELANKANAATYAALSPLAPNDTTVSQAPTFSERYNENIESQRKQDKSFEEAHPVISTAANIAGGVGSLGALAARAPAAAEALGLTGSSLPGMAAKGAVSGAALSGGDAALRGEDVKSAVIVGGVTGAAAPVVGAGIGKAAQAVKEAVTPVQRVPQNVRTVAGADVPISQGQLTGDFDTIMREQAAARGGLGQEAQQTARGFFDNQREALDQASDNVRSLIGDRRGTVFANNPLEAGEMVSDAVRRKAADAKATYQRGYKDFGQMAGDFESQAFDGLGRSIRNKLSQRAEPVIVDDVTTPVAARALQDLDETLGGAIPTNRASPLGNRTPAGDTFSIQDMDQARKRLTTMYSQIGNASPTAASDKRALGNIIGAFDDHVEQALLSPLFSGDEAAYGVLKSARKSYADYAKNFRPQGPGDDVGTVIQKIVGRYDGQAATPNEVANYLYGATNVGAKGQSVRVAQRLKSMLGDDSEEWFAVRQGLWSKLTEPPAGMTDWGPQKVSERIFKFLNGDGQVLSHVLFDAEERKLISQFGTVLKQLVPPTGSVNHSNTAPVLMRIAKGSMDGLAAIGGFSLGGPLGAMLGIGTNAAIKTAQESARNKQIARLLYQAPSGPAGTGARDLTTMTLRGSQPAFMN